MTSLLLRIDEPRELLALVPHLLGFLPHDSAVAVSLRGPRRRVGLVARVDLDDVADLRHGPQVARALAAHLDRDGARAAVLVVYAGADPGDPRPAEAARHVAEAFDVPFGGVEVLVVGDGRYRCLDCASGCCPPGGRPLSDLESTRAGAEMVLAGSVVAPERDQLGTVAPAPVVQRRAVARARRRRGDARARAHLDGPAAVARWRTDALEAWRALVAVSTGEGVDGPTPPLASRPVRSRPALLGRVEAGLDDRRVRDAVLVTLLPSAGSLPDRSLARGGAAEDDELRSAVAALVDPDRACAPGPEVAAAETALREVVAHGRRGAQAPATTLLATVAWWRGDGARASVLLDRALHDDPAYRLALLLRSAVDAGLAPGWARRPA